MSETSQPSLEDPDHRVESLIRALPLEAKLAQLTGLWAGAKRTDDAAPLQERLVTDGIHFEDFAAAGLGQLTRHYGTTPLEPGVARDLLARRQRWLIDNAPGGIPAVVHEECLTGVMAWKAIAYPTPLAWGATFSPKLIERMGARIGADLRALGIHQGLAPVLDVVRDLRWGRVEECIAEDSLVVGALGSAYVRGLESQGRVATLKHFAGYAASRAGRNHGSVAMGRRELEDAVLPPFERAIREGGARSVMNAYTALDGIPAAADASLLTGVLRDRWGFTGTVVADYFAIAFLESMHGVAGDLGAAAALALRAGLDVELPTGSGYREPLRHLVEAGEVPELLIDRALRRVLRQKAELGLLDGAGMPEDGPIELDGPEHRAIAREVAEASIVLLENRGLLPLTPPQKIAVLGPNAADISSLFGCYSFVNHVLTRHPDVPIGVDVATVLDAVRAEFPQAAITHATGCSPTGEDRAGFQDAVRLAAEADVAVVVLGDRAGMFGAGTSGEGCDAVDLKLPGVQHEFAAAVIATGTPVVLVLVTGRPYELRDLAAESGGAAAIVQAFFPATEGAAAIAGVLSGRVNPSGRLPVGLPGDHAPQPSGYRHERLDGKTGVSSADPTPRYPFGFGLSYTTFAQSAPTLGAAEVATDGVVVVRTEVRNVGDRAGAEVVQVYAHDPVASVTRPLRELVAFARVEIAAGESTTLEFRLPSRSFSFTDGSLQRVVEPGRIDLTLARNAGDPGSTVSVTFTGSRRVVPAAEYDLSSWSRA